ncbi:hypothetical protein GNE08_19345 [Trichormus variabilis ARAD]|uniref:Uncharacterized protein n=1 Tax=Trichormus variabilis N2B TaxID=2681315 RepID=A0ABR6SFR3_ANAVA|nr:MULTISPECIES: hypothetical protein [Nostocaceae]MBC1216373.1 hypothetical protein [Trichormus variabilis ARAD]MBC1258312.1 hypothetical protein [Trichormus variabilis V5]MBC1270290.1 hypothetical protein [Trichormus variabilis FSR]MBC1305250.1 hypothetical protein [Trichormus variabilis N2B]MBC1310290.1 hypothetical protein [Trichormus variabilis PNB]
MSCISDVVVAGASPSEPYNGSVVLEEIKQQIRALHKCGMNWDFCTQQNIDSLRLPFKFRLRYAC